MSHAAINTEIAWELNTKFAKLAKAAKIDLSEKAVGAIAAKAYKHWRKP